MSHVLIVEDDPDVREVLESLLQHHGYATETACNGAEGLERAERVRPALVLLDLAMPVMNGWQFRERQLQTPAIADVPVICVTAESEPHERGHVLGAPCLRKPINLEIVINAVRQAVEREKQEDSAEILEGRVRVPGAPAFDVMYHLWRAGDECWVGSITAPSRACITTFLERQPDRRIRLSDGSEFEFTIVRRLASAAMLTVSGRFTGQERLRSPVTPHGEPLPGRRVSRGVRARDTRPA